MSDIESQAADVLVRSAMVQLEIKSQSKSRPIYGGVFGSGGYRLSSWFCISRGLFEVHYFVLHESTFATLGMGRTKADAIAAARDCLTSADPLRLQRIFSRALVGIKSELAALHRAHEEKMAARRADAKAVEPKAIRSVPKRRQEIFDKSEGKCHYCQTTLTLDGKWHIEHKMPKALMGSNEPSNLVASCVACNMKKRDKTDEEFIAQQGKATA